MSGVLHNIKVGDKLRISNGYSWKIGVVEEVLKSCVVVNGTKFNKRSGDRVPFAKWDMFSARPATEEDVQTFNALKRRSKMINAIENAQLTSLSDSQLERILEIINQKPKEQ